MGSELEANSSAEICTGKKKPFPEILKFKMHKGGAFTADGQKTNRFGVKSKKYNFYLGGTDSCQGTRWSPAQFQLQKYIHPCKIIVLRNKCTILCVNSVH